MFITKIQILS